LAGEGGGRRPTDEGLRSCRPVISSPDFWGSSDPSSGPDGPPSPTRGEGQEMRMTHTIFIDGEAGTTGLEIRERLEARGDLELMLLGDRRRDVEARREALNSADAVILCLPDDAAREA